MEITNKAKEYSKKKSLVYSCQYHVIFCPKYRRAVLVDAVELRTRELILEYQDKFHYKIIELEIMPDHVHLLIESTDPKFGIYKSVGRIKGITSRFIREEFPTIKSRLPSLWTRSKFISTVGSVSLEVVKQYIMDQKNK